MRCVWCDAAAKLTAASNLARSLPLGSIPLTSPRKWGNSTPRLHRAFGNLKTWLRGTHHGVSKKHLQVYLDEFVFRFNRRQKPMAAFQSLLGLTSLHHPTSYKMLYSSEPTK